MLGSSGNLATYRSRVSNSVSWRCPSLQHPPGQKIIAEVYVAVEFQLVPVTSDSAILWSYLPDDQRSVELVNRVLDQKPSTDLLRAALTWLSKTLGAKYFGR